MYEVETSVHLASYDAAGASRLPHFLAFYSAELMALMRPMNRTSSPPGFLPLCTV